MKKAAFELTYTKLIGLILGVVLLALIIWSLYNKTLQPAINRVGIAFDEVLTFIGIKDEPPTTYDCKPRFLISPNKEEELPGTEELIKTLPELLSGDGAASKATFTLCGGECTLNLGRKNADGTEQQYKLGNTQEKNSYAFYWAMLDPDAKINIDYSSEAKAVWKRNNYYLKSKDTLLAREHRELYQNMIAEFNKEEFEQLKDYYTKRFTKRIIIRADGEGKASTYPSYFTWHNGYYHYYHEKTFPEDRYNPLGYGEIEVYPELLLYQGTDGKKALGLMRQQAYYDGFFGSDDGVTYLLGEPFNPRYSQDSIKQLQSIDGLVGYCDGNNQLDCPSEYNILYDELEKKGKQYLTETQVTPQELQDLQELIQGKTLVYEGITYDYIIIQEGEYYHLGLHPRETTTKRTLGLRFDPLALTDKVYTEGQRFKPLTSFVELPGFLPVALVEYEPAKLSIISEGIYAGTGVPVVTSKKDYMLSNEEFKNFEKNKIIREFLIATCR